MELTISLAQIDIALGQPQVNLAKVQELTAEAKRRGSDVVLFPELWPTGYDLENAEQHAPSCGPQATTLRTQSNTPPASMRAFSPNWPLWPGKTPFTSAARSFPCKMGAITTPLPSSPRQENGWGTTAKSTSSA